MSHNPAKTAVCQVCHEEKPLNQMMPAETLRDNIVQVIRKKIRIGRLRVMFVWPI